MEHLQIEPTNYSPSVSFNPSGVLSIKGRSLMLRASSYYKPLINWIAGIEAKTVHFTVEMDCFNSMSSKKLLEMLKIVDENNNIGEFVVYWGFEMHDEDTLLKGQNLERRLKKARFQFLKLAGV